jgi:hypothetical protein
VKRVGEGGVVVTKGWMYKGIFFVLVSLGCRGEESGNPAWFLESPDGVVLSLPSEGGGRWRLQQQTSRGWKTLARIQRSDDLLPVPWFVPTADLANGERAFRWLGSGSEVPVVQRTAELVFTGQERELFEAHEPLGLEVKLESTAIDAAEAFVTRTGLSALGLDTGWLQPVCQDGDSRDACFADDEQAWTGLRAGRWAEVPHWDRYSSWPVDVAITVLARVPANTAEGRQLVTVASGSTEFYSLGRELVWGDPHAQSNLSWDGCEVDEQGCISRFGTPAADFFQQARAAGLQFAALTDSSEASSYFPNGVLAREYGIWEEQIAAVKSFEREDFIPLLGYEWSPHDMNRARSEAPWSSGARVLLFEARDPCEDYRVAAQRAQANLEKGVGSYSPFDGVVDNTATGLYRAIEWAGASCGFEPLVAFVAHGTQEPSINWESPENQGDPRWETGFEITSERGQFECLDAADEACDVETDYAPEGSYQAALLSGRRLGVLGATDAHDGRPGSVGDGPSTRWLFGEGSQSTVQAHGGGLTGVWVSEPLSAVGLVDGMQRRHTVASAGQVLASRVLGVGADGVPLLPGSLVLDAGWPISVKLVFDGEEEPGHVVQWVEADGAVVATSAASSGWVTLPAPATGAVYGRVASEAGETLLWVSPFFRDTL